MTKLNGWKKNVKTMMLFTVLAHFPLFNSRLDYRDLYYSVSNWVISRTEAHHFWVHFFLLFDFIVLYGRSAVIIFTYIQVVLIHVFLVIFFIESLLNSVSEFVGWFPYPFESRVPCPFSRARGVCVCIWYRGNGNIIPTPKPLHCALAIGLFLALSIAARADTGEGARIRLHT